MDNQKISKMVERVANSSEHDEALANVDQAIDGLIANYTVLEEYLPKVKAANVPQQASLDTIKETMDEAIGPYLMDIVKAIEIFGGE